MIEPWKKIGDRVDYDCGFFKVHVQRSLSPLTGKEHPFYVLDTHDWVNVIALTPEKEVLLVSQFRHGSGEISAEIPGGAVDRKDASPLAAAQRELLEETGHEAPEWFSLGSVRPNPAILNNRCHFFLARGAQRVADLSLDEAEELEVKKVPRGEIGGQIRAGKITHALVIAAFQLLELFEAEKPDKR
ncbi:MAG TPA: NUDIX hydrolase [bacterium]|nr:NUDIX hydrolase [bacterium]